jgi:DNA-binding transcriptional ArsR family regulator
MTDDIEKQYGNEAEIFKALSHPTRIFILHSIKKEQLTVTELAGKAGIDISTMSKHLDLLKRHKIILSKKIKNTVYYKINMPCVFSFLGCAKAITSCPTNCNNELCLNIKSLTNNQENLL